MNITSFTNQDGVFCRLRLSYCLFNIYKNTRRHFINEKMSRPDPNLLLPRLVKFYLQPIKLKIYLDIESFIQRN